MAKYLFVYHGGENPKSDEEAAEVMDAWGNWLGSMGSAVVDGGNPVGQSSTVHPDGSVTNDGGANPASGYSLVEASSLEDAHRESEGLPDPAGEGLDRGRRDLRYVAARAGARSRAEARSYRWTAPVGALLEARTGRGPARRLAGRLPANPE